jgi:heterodisulfide reductase subunit A-like polyferredoxin
MVIVDRDRCAYCGGCVGVCSVGALVLAETRLLVDDSCIDCGDCIAACPVGALQSETSSTTQSGPTARRRYDLVVIGAGPGGSIAALTAAQAGLYVLLLEKRQEIGSPVR